MLFLIFITWILICCNAFDGSTIKLLHDLQEVFNTDWLIIFLQENYNVINSAKILKLRKSPFTSISVFGRDDFVRLKNGKLAGRLPMVFHYRQQKRNTGISPDKSFEKFGDFPGYHRFLWIIITPDDAFRKFENIYVPLNCQFIVCEKSETGDFNLMAIYKTSETSKLYHDNFGTWKPFAGLSDLVSTDFLFKRMNFHLQKIRVNKLTDITGGIFARLPNFLPSAWEKVSERLNITSDYTTSANFDVNINSNSLVEPPGPHHEYIHVLFNIQINLFYRELESRFGLTAYLNPFSKYVWISIIIWMIITSGFMTFIMIKTPSKTKGMRCNFAWRILDVLAILCQQDMDLESGSDAVKMIATLHLLSSMLLFGVYSAVFISFIAISVHKSPFDELSLEGVLRHGEYKILVVRNKAYPFFRNNQHPTVRSLFERQLPPYEEQPVTFMEGFDQVCYSPKKYLTEFPPAAINDLKPKLKKCKISQDSIFLNRFPGTWLFEKGSPYKNVIHISMLKLTESGAVSNNIIFRRLFLKKTIESDVFDPIELNQVISLFIVFGLGLTLAIFLLNTEKFFFKSKNQFRKNVCDA